MIKLKIVNWLQKEEGYYIGERLTDGSERYADRLNEHCDVKPYDMEKWKDGRIYEFDTLKEAKEFTNSCDIGIADNAKEQFGDYDWYTLCFEYDIDLSEDNLIIFNISMEHTIMY